MDNVFYVLCLFLEIILKNVDLGIKLKKTVYYLYLKFIWYGNYIFYFIICVYVY